VSSNGSSNEAYLAVAPGPLAAPVLSRVVGMLAARAGCPIDRLDDALLIADAVAASAGAYSADGRVGVHVSAQVGAVELNVGPLREEGATALVASASLPGVGNILERVADELAPERENDHEYLKIRMTFGTPRPSGSTTLEEPDAP
jgi:hypothetical protein